MLRLADDVTLDTVIECSGCSWTGRYNPDIASFEGRSDGGSDYTDAELDHMRVSDALGMAREDHPGCEGA